MCCQIWMLRGAVRKCVLSGIHLCLPSCAQHPIKKATIFKPLFLKMAGQAVQLTRKDLVEPGLLGSVNNVNRSGNAFAAGTYAGADAFADGLDKAGLDAAAGAYAAAGLGCARAEWSVFDAEAKGPNASAGAGASLSSVSAKAFARAEIASASASAGPVKATVGLGLDTGVGIGVTGVEAKVLGTGISFGRKMGISLFGTGFEFNLW
uniref:Uncharacterized protein n=1 Tax=Oreochromis aureus TaxID=47969 RepID=A0A668SK26_OREAU